MVALASCIACSRHCSVEGRRMMGASCVGTTGKWPGGAKGVNSEKKFQKRNNKRRNNMKKKNYGKRARKGKKKTDRIPHMCRKKKEVQWS